MFHFWRRAEDSTSICIFIRIPQTFLETLNATFHVLTHQAKKKKSAFVVSQNANVIFVSKSIKRPSMNEHVILADQIIFLVLLICTCLLSWQPLELIDRVSTTIDMRLPTRPKILTAVSKIPSP